MRNHGQNLIQIQLLYASSATQASNLTAENNASHSQSETVTPLTPSPPHAPNARRATTSPKTANHASLATSQSATTVLSPPTPSSIPTRPVMLVKTTITLLESIRTTIGPSLASSATGMTTGEETSTALFPTLTTRMAARPAPMVGTSIPSARNVSHALSSSTDAQCVTTRLIPALPAKRASSLEVASVCRPPASRTNSKRMEPALTAQTELTTAVPAL